MSDRVAGIANLETPMDDVRAVMDAKGSKRALATLLPQSMSPGAATSLDRMGSGIAFSERGTRELKGVPGEWRLFAVAREPAGTASP